MGLGTAILLKVNSSTGGSDLISYLAKSYKPELRTSNIIVIIDALIVALNVIFFKEIEVGLYSAIAIYIMGKIIDIFFEGVYFTKLIFIISDKNEKIADLENGVAAMCTTSGQAASLISVLNLASAGDRILSTSAIYGGTVGKMSFFNSIFDGLTELSQKLPEINIQTFYIIVFVALGAVAAIIGLTFFAAAAYKMRRACSKVLSYLENEDVIGDDNAAGFTSACFGAKAPAAMREAWVSYLGVRFGYPSEVMDSSVFDKEVKHPDSVRANVYISVALILTALFTFWGLGAMGTAEVGVVLCLGLLIAAVGYLVLWLVARSEYKTAAKKYAAMQDALDAKVNLSVERDYATDASPLLQVAAIMDGIVARNTARPAPTEEEVAALVKEREAETAQQEPAAEQGAEAPAEEKTPLELAAEEGAEAPAEEAAPAEETAFEPVEEEAPADPNAPETGIPPVVGHREDEGKGRDTVAEEIENNDEDEKNMFGRKKKKLQNAELTARGYDDLIVDAELLPDDDDDDDIAEAQLVSVPAPAQPYAAAPAQPAMARGSEPESLEGLNIARRPVADESVTVSLEPEVIYVEEDLDEGDEDVKPPRLAKLPHLVDYVLTMNLSRSMKIRVAMLMLQAYNVFKNSPENKAIVIQCLTKIMKVLMADQAKAKAEREAAEAQQAAAADTAAQ